MKSRDLHCRISKDTLLLEDERESRIILIDVVDVESNREKLDYVKSLPGVTVEVVDFSQENRHRLFTNGKGICQKN